MFLILFLFVYFLVVFVIVYHFCLLFIESRVVTPGSYSWQKFNHTNNPLPGSASAVGQRILASILAQFAERRLFLYLFGYNYGDVMESVFMGIASSLSDLEGEVPADQMGGAGGDKDGDMELFQSSPIKYFLEVCGYVCV